MKAKDPPINRRTALKTVTTAGGVVALPVIGTVSVSATTSGNVEVTTATTQPTGTSVSITGYEDTSGDGVADRSQTESVPDGTATTEFETLEAEADTGSVYWFDVSLSTTDTAVTPEVDSLSVTLPDGTTDPTPTPTPTPTPEPEPIPRSSQPGGERHFIFSLWDNFLMSVILMTGLVAFIGMMSKSLAVGALGAYIAFAYIAIQTGYPMLINILYVTLIMVFVGFAFKFWRLEGMGE